MPIDFFAKMLQDKKEGKKPKPFQHPKLEEDRYRVFFDDIKATTEKATLFILEGDVKMWIPNSQFIMRWGREHTGLTDADKKNCIDVTAWFYETEIDNKHRKG